MARRKKTDKILRKLHQQKYNLKQSFNKSIINQAKTKKKSEAQENMVDPNRVLLILSKIKGEKSYSDETLCQTQDFAT